jgi:DNA ligase D-like protein (predicted 3'-phosphoesterase)
MSMQEELNRDFGDGVIKKLKNHKLKRPVYVVQEHHATRLHWDLRFEINGTLKSWALPKGVPEGDEKRLAVHVDDHPIEYAAFEGTIPEGGYGAGEVKIFDKGTFKMESYDPDKKMVVNITGKKLKGRYCLIHFKPNENNWLFFKVKD